MARATAVHWPPVVSCTRVQGKPASQKLVAVEEVGASLWMGRVLRQEAQQPAVVAFQASAESSCERVQD